MKKLMLILSILIVGFVDKAEALPIYWAQADLIGVEGCCATVRISVYQLDNGQTRLVYSGNVYANLFGETNCCPEQGISKGDPNNSEGFYEFYMANSENQAMIDDAVALAISDYSGKKDFSPSQNLDVSVFPNPANQNLSLKLPSTEMLWVKYTVFNSAGEPVILQDRQPFEGGLIEIPINRISESGAYFIEIDINGVRDIRKIEIVR